jgi:hypothetical protein
MGPAACEQPLPEPTETVIATVDPATWAKVMDRSDHLPRYSLQVFNAPAPGETVFWGVERYDEKVTRPKYLPIITLDYIRSSDWHCFANEKPAAMQERNGVKYILLEGKEYGPFGEDERPYYLRRPPPAFQAVKRDGKSYLSSAEKQYGPFDQMGEFADYGQRVMFWFQRGGRWYAAVDDEEFGPYDYRASWAELRFQFGFSSDGKRSAFTARRPAGWYVVVDGQEYGPYEFPADRGGSSSSSIFAPRRDQWWDVLGDLLAGGESGPRYHSWQEPHFEFSPDGKRFAFTARRPAGWYLVMDGQEYGPYELPRGRSEFPFGFDNAHFALTARRGGQWWLVVDGTEIGPLEAEPWWEFAGHDVCYIAKQRGAFRIVLGDKEWGPYEEAEASLGWRGGDGNPRRAFRVKRGGVWYAMSGDLELGPFEELHACGLSPDGSRIIAFAGRGGEWYAMMEGAKYGPYERLVAKFSPSLVDVTFSHTSGQVAFAAWRGGQWLLVVDGQEYPSGYGELSHQELMSATNFSPDGQRAVLAFRIGAGNRPHSSRLLLVITPGGRIEPLWFKQDGGRDFASALPDWWEDRFPVWNPNSGKLMGIVCSSQTTDSFWTEGYLGKTYQEIYSESLRLDGPDAVTFVAGNEGKLLFVRQPLS